MFKPKSCVRSLHDFRSNLTLSCVSVLAMPEANKQSEHDAEYFSSYFDLEVHRLMLRDTARTNAYQKAIMDNKEWIKGKVVMGEKGFFLVCFHRSSSLFTQHRRGSWLWHLVPVLLARGGKEGVRGGGQQDGRAVGRHRGEEQGC